MVVPGSHSPSPGKGRGASEGGDDGFQRTHGFALTALGHFRVETALPPTTPGLGEA